MQFRGVHHYYNLPLAVVATQVKVPSYRGSVAMCIFIERCTHATTKKSFRDPWKMKGSRSCKIINQESGKFQSIKIKATFYTYKEACSFMCVFVHSYQRLSITSCLSYKILQKSLKIYSIQSHQAKYIHSFRYMWTVCKCISNRL